MKTMAFTQTFSLSLLHLLEFFIVFFAIVLLQSALRITTILIADQP